MLQVLVTGATGFVGSHLVRALQGMGHIVYATGTAGEERLFGVHSAGYDLSDVPERVLNNVSVVFHQAANNDTQCQDRMTMLIDNYDAPAMLFKRAYGAGCRNFVYASSAAVYGNQSTPWIEDETGPRPLTPYADSKLKFEHFATKFAELCHCNVVGLRYCNVYGPGEYHKGKRASMIHQLGSQILKGLRPRIFTDGNQSRDWVYVRDVVRANLKAAQRGLRVDWTNDPFADPHLLCNVSSGESVTFNQLIQIFNEEIPNMSEPVEPIYIDNPFQSTYQDCTESDISLARCRLGWTPRYGIRRGIRSMIKHWLNSPASLAPSFST